ncbi:MAG: 30S ribosomal protein S20 [Dehalococcoidales bacterium]
MASKSAQKAARGSVRKQERNTSTRSQVKTDITRAEKLITEGNVEKAREAAVVALSALDKAAGKKVLHSNNAARRKSRLLKKLNKAGTAQKAKPTPEKAA